MMSRDEISTRQGLQTIITPSMKRLRVSDSGIVAPDGSRLSFQWDHQGRLSAVITDDGSRVVYAYDSRGNLMSVYSTATDQRTVYGYQSERAHLLEDILARRISRAGRSPTATTVVF